MQNDLYLFRTVEIARRNLAFASLSESCEGAASGSGLPLDRVLALVAAAEIGCWKARAELAEGFFDGDL